MTLFTFNYSIILEINLVSEKNQWYVKWGTISQTFEPLFYLIVGSLVRHIKHNNSSIRLSQITLRNHSEFILARSVPYLKAFGFGSAFNREVFVVKLESALGIRHLIYVFILVSLDECALAST